MPRTPVDLNDIEQDILEAARDAAAGITQRLLELWRDEYEDESRTVPPLFDTFEHLLQFETACRLREMLGSRARSWRYVSWEHRYSDGWRSGLLDLVVSPTQEHADLDQRLAIEVKWMSEKASGLAYAASDALKLVWATASARYLLLFGLHTPETLVARITQAVEDDHQMRGWLSTPESASDLKAARRVLTDAHDQMYLVDHRPPTSRHDVAVALVRIPDGAPSP